MSKQTALERRDGACREEQPIAELPRWRRSLGLPVALILAFLALVLVPPMRDDARLMGTFLGVGAGLFAWLGMLRRRAARGGPAFRIERAPLLRSHYVQAGIQLCIYAFWGWYWRDVYAEIPQIVSQLLFIYAFDALLSWSRGRSWLLGCGPLPIVLSTNVFLWFNDDWYFLQFALIALGVLGKAFITWNKGGKRTHVFNPSAFTLAVFAIVLLATGATDEITGAARIADTLDDGPHIYLLIFLLGLVVQHFFSVTLMTFAAVAVLVLLNLAHHWSTGTYFFGATNLPAPVFLGLHLLMTDPSTSPRTNAGRVAFGACYGLSAFLLYGVLSHFGASTVYDKLLPVPFLNLGVQTFDRIAQRGLLGRLTRWESAFRPRLLNVAHMVCWTALFVPMLTSGYVEGPHEGGTYAFWRKALDEGRPGAARGMVDLLKALAKDGSAEAYNELGMIHMEGVLVERDAAAALRFFGKACKMGSVAGSANVAAQFLSAPHARTGVVVDLAFDQLEKACGTPTDPTGGAAHYLLGRAYASGRGRPQDAGRARELYEQACRLGIAQACAEIGRAPPPPSTP